MPKPPRTGQKVQDLFSKMEEPDKTEGERQPGRPRKHADAWSKVSVVLFDRQTLLLDQLASEIRAANQKIGKKVILRRAELIRAFVDAVLESKIDLREVTSEEDIKELIQECLNSGRP